MISIPRVWKVGYLGSPENDGRLRSIINHTDSYPKPNQGLTDYR